MFFTVFIAIKMKTFLLFLALTCATTTATPNGNGEPLSACKILEMDIWNSVAFKHLNFFFRSTPDLGCHWI